MRDAIVAEHRLLFPVRATWMRRIRMTDITYIRKLEGFAHVSGMDNM